MIAAKEMTQDLTSAEKDVIAYSIDNGFTNGSIGNVEWELENNKQESLTLIASKIKYNRNGYSYPHWNLTFKRYSSIEI